MTSFHHIAFDVFAAKLEETWNLCLKDQLQFMTDAGYQFGKPGVEQIEHSIGFSCTVGPAGKKESHRFSLRFPYPDATGRFNMPGADGNCVVMEACNYLDPDERLRDCVGNPDFDPVDVGNYLLQPAWNRLLFQVRHFVKNARIVSCKYHGQLSPAEYFLSRYCTAAGKKSGLFRPRDQYGYFAAEVRKFSVLTDETNPLALLTQNKAILRRRAFPVMSADEKQEFRETPENERQYYKVINEMSMLPAFRDIHPSYRGKLCPVESPESKKVGLSLQMAAGVKVSEQGRLECSDDSPGARCSIGILQIPFLSHNHSPRLMMGGKNLKQALPPVDPELPLVQTGWETRAVKMLDDSGLEAFRRAPESGEYRMPDAYHLRLRPFGAKPGDEKEIPLYGLPVSGKPLPVWFKAVSDKGRTEKGQIIAVRNGILQNRKGEFALALGTNLNVIYMPWYGYNFEDAIVISRRASQKLATRLVYKLFFPRCHGALPDNGQQFAAGQCFIAGCEDSAVPMWAEKAEVIDSGSVEKKGEVMNYVTFAAIVPVGIGDKLMGRYGNKGVVAKILSDDELPTIELPDGRTVKPDLILNPNGILSRKNLGQLFETQLGLLSELSAADFARLEVFARPFATIDKPDLAEDIVNCLEKAGCKDGQVDLKLPNGKNIRVTGGIQYFCRLNHNPWMKLTLRGRLDEGKGLNGQPRASIKKYGVKNGSDGGQRMGEMEMWAMFAHGALNNLKEMTLLKSARMRGGDSSRHRSFELFLHYLFAMGIRVNPVNGRVAPLQSVAEAENYAREMAWKFTSEPQSAAQECWPDKFRLLDFDKISGADGSVFSLEENLRPVNSLTGKPLSFIAVPPALDFPVAANRKGSSGRKGAGGCSFEKPYLIRLYEAFFKQVREKNEKIQELYDRITGLTGSEPAKIKVIRPVNKNHYYLSTLLLGKQGLVRKSLLGRRLDCSGRAVIIPAPDLNPCEVYLPSHYAACFSKDFKAGTCLLNRNPSLHKYSLNACRIKQWPGCKKSGEPPVIGLSPLLCGPFGADFDGDTMAFHMPISFQAEKELEERVSFAQNCFSAATGKNLAHFDLDLKLGLYCLTEYPEGKELFTELLKRFPLKKEHAAVKPADMLKDPSACKLFIDDSRQNYVGFMHGLSEIAFRVITERGYSIGLADMIKLQKAYGDRNSPQKSSEIQKKLVELAGRLRSDSSFFDIPVSGAKDGKCSDLRQMTVMAGKIDCLFSDPELVPQMREPEEVKGRFLQGFNPDDFWSACREGRNGMVKKKLATALAGHFTRMLVEAAFPWQVSNIDDCGATEGIQLPEGKTAGRIAISGAPGYYRSPVTCRLPGRGVAEFCRTCCGNDPSTGQKFEPGTHIGVLAAETVGERGTQEAMKAFHRGAGTAESKNTDQKEKHTASSRKKKSAKAAPTSLMDIFRAAMPLHAQNKSDSEDSESANTQGIHFLGHDGIVARYQTFDGYGGLLPLAFEFLAAARTEGDQILPVRRSIRKMAPRYGLYGISGSENFIRLLKEMLVNCEEPLAEAHHPKHLLLNFPATEEGK